MLTTILASQASSTNYDYTGLGIAVLFFLLAVAVPSSIKIGRRRKRGS